MCTKALMNVEQELIDVLPSKAKVIWSNHLNWKNSHHLQV